MEKLNSFPLMENCLKAYWSKKLSRVYGKTEK